jgi:hypothetical protein
MHFILTLFLINLKRDFIMKIDCPNCQVVFDAGDNSYGEILKCPACREDVAVPFQNDSIGTYKNIKMPSPPPSPLKKLENTIRNAKTHNSNTYNTKNFDPKTCQEKDSKTSTGYKPPMLVPIFKWLGVLSLLGTCFSLLVIIYSISTGNMVGSQIISVAVVLLIYTFINFGLSQLANIFGRMAYFTEKIYGRIDRI